MPFVDTDGARVCYELWRPEKGGSQWVTILNGHTRTLEDFRSFAAYLTRKGYSVMSLDNRGSGKTELHRKFSLGDIAKDVRAVWAAVGIKSSHLVAFSFGGAVAQWLAAEQPEELEKLVLISTRSQWNLTIPDLSAPNFMVEMQKYFSKSFFKAQEGFIKHFGVEVQKRARDPELAQGIAWQREALEGMDLSPKLAKITVPTLIIHGEEDGVVPFSSAETLHRGIAGSRVAPLKGIGHLPLVECASALFATVEGFLAERPGFTGRQP